MKKCSHSKHETLTELNITPLLDLAFVLLVIFIITTTPIVNDLDLSLPNASKHAKDPPRKANYITVEASGSFTVGAWCSTSATKARCSGLMFTSAAKPAIVKTKKAKGICQ